jgi:hypothetical protein
MKEVSKRSGENFLGHSHYQLLVKAKALSEEPGSFLESIRGKKRLPLLFFVVVGSDGSCYGSVVFDSYFTIQVQVAVYYVCLMTQVQLARVGADADSLRVQLIVGATLVATGFGGSALRMSHGSGNVEC